ncbi:C2 domain containing protein [Metarhizium album ARSEF 1941]|uniref:C2 domain containing protein n=1 Tax=Metarhizium album (strain ARSEF 1941) TaxID=1081103 RepID=A0A0B2WSB4_METAS|nr:C2 domain containing protein [Metarhizium album ARSEF 1941]KHN98966.1 C2 domain containing protein [Metarhizium album ARSEF 1941]
MAAIAQNLPVTTDGVDNAKNVDGVINSGHTKPETVNPPSVNQTKPEMDAENLPNASDGTNHDNDQANDNPNDNAGRDASNTENPQSPEVGTWRKPKPLKSTSAGLKRAIKGKKPPGGFDASPLPDAPQGYTVRFTFRYATNLPAADLSTASSDPFLTATLTASNPKRHKEDPDLVHRTRTLRKTTEPQWNEEWVVANVPPSGFTLKCRLYDEDFADHDDRLGNVTIHEPRVFEQWEGIPPPGREYAAKIRVMSKRALIVKAIACFFRSDVHLTPKLCVSIEVIGKSDPPFAQMCTIGPTRWTKHFSPMIGRIAGTKVNENEEHDQDGGRSSQVDNSGQNGKERSQKYDFQANEMQLQGPVPPELYHRYVEFRPIIGSMFSSKGIRGKILNMALHKQHNRVYNYDQTTEWGSFEPCSEAATLAFLRLAHFDEGGRTFTYVLTLDGLFKFTETGKEFGIDLLSKHTMHSNVQTYIACSGEFFIRRLERPVASDDPEPAEKTHPSNHIPGGPPDESPPPNPAYYQLFIDNDSGTYRPDKSILPKLKEFFERNFPNLGVVTMHWEEEELQKLKEAQRSAKKQEGRMVNVVLNRSRSSISSAESELDDRDETWESGKKSKREALLAAVENPRTIKDALNGSKPANEGKEREREREREGEGEGEREGEGEGDGVGRFGGFWRRDVFAIFKVLSSVCQRMGLAPWPSTLYTRTYFDTNIFFCCMPASVVRSLAGPGDKVNANIASACLP